MKVITSDASELVKEIFWVAWQACHGPVGMGVFQDKPGASREQVWQNVVTRGDYTGPLTLKDGTYYGDYVFGRMMKLSVTLKDGVVEVSDNAPRADYQGWSRVFPSYKALLEEAAKRIGATVQPYKG